MRRASVVALAALTFLAGNSSALPPVQLDTESPTVAAFYGQFETMCDLFAASGFDLPTVDSDIDYWAVDIESIEGDAVPDLCALSLLASAIDANAGLATTHADNKWVYEQHLAAIAGLFAWPTPPAVFSDAVSALGNLILNHVQDLSASQLLELQLLESDLDFLAFMLADFANEDGAYRPVLQKLGLIADVLPAMAGLSSEMEVTIREIFDHLLLGELYAIENTCTEALDLLASVELLMLDLDPGLDATIDSIRQGLQEGAGIDHPTAFPPMAIYGAETPENEPFSASGDYDGDGTTNGAAYAFVSGGGGDVADFVAAASGFKAVPIPAAAMPGLLMLACAIGCGGALLIRTKRHHAA